MKTDSQTKIDKAMDSKPAVNTRRVHMITNISFENS